MNNQAFLNGVVDELEKSAMGDDRLAIMRANRKEKRRSVLRPARSGGGAVDAPQGSVLGDHDPSKALFKGADEDMGGPRPSEEAVIKFLDKHPRPTDEQFHSWAESQGYNTHKAEAAAYGILSDLINKGRSKGKAPAGIAPKDVKEGVKIEAEHTPNKMLQRKITDDHNTELKKYYDKKKGLPAMEKKLEKSAMGMVSQGQAAIDHKKRGMARVAKEKKATIVKPTGALLSKIRPGTIKKTAGKAAAFMEGFLDELEKEAADVGPVPTQVDITKLFKPFIPKVKKGLSKTAGPPTLAKLRRAYPKGKVKPPVADPGAAAKIIGPNFPKAATSLGGSMNSLTTAFFIGLTDELEKGAAGAACATPGKKIRSKGKGKGLALGKGKGPKGIPKKADFLGSESGKAKAVELNKHIQAAGGNVQAGVASYNKAKKGKKGQEKKAGVLSNALYKKVTGKDKKKLFGKGGLVHDTDKGSSVKAKIEAARRDPSTKANPNDTGPKGSGTQDPRFKAMKKKGAEEAFLAGFDEGMGK